MKYRSLASACTYLAVAVAAGCSSQSEGGSVLQYFDVDNGNVVVHAAGVPDAVVTPNGELRIAGNAVDANPAQQDLLKHLHATALSLRAHAIATGKAGAETGLQAVASVASGLASGNTDKIDREINSKAAKIEAQAALLCANLAHIRSTQMSLASQLPAFRPYATIDAKTVANCKTQ